MIGDLQVAGVLRMVLVACRVGVAAGFDMRFGEGLPVSHGGQLRPAAFTAGGVGGADQFAGMPPARRERPLPHRDLGNVNDQINLPAAVGRTICPRRRSGLQRQQS